MADEKTKTAQELAADIDAKLQKADADGDKLDAILAGLTKIGETCEAHGKALSGLSDRLDALEAPAADADPSGDDPVPAAYTDSKRKRADADTPESRQAKATAQMACDAVAMVWGERAPAPLVGESEEIFGCACWRLGKNTRRRSRIWISTNRRG
jgi:hypothetical protein